MLERTFIIIDSIGDRTERELWKQHITCWQDFLSADSVSHMGPQRKDACNSQIMLAMDAMEHGDVDHFRQRLPSNRMWRLWNWLKDDALFLDIETTGLGPGADVTVVGLGDRRGTRTLVQGKDLSADAIRELVRGHRLLVTFNGCMFDVPFLEDRYGKLGLSEMAHLDLRFAARRAGWSGGLKKIERIVGITRAKEVQGVDGLEAVRLWYRWKGGDRKALGTLLEYNIEDVENLPKLADIVVERLEHDVFERVVNG